MEKNNVLEQVNTDLWTCRKCGADTAIVGFTVFNETQYGHDQMEVFRCTSCGSCKEHETSTCYYD